MKRKPNLRTKDGQDAAMLDHLRERKGFVSVLHLNLWQHYALDRLRAAGRILSHGKHGFPIWHLVEVKP